MTNSSLKETNKAVMSDTPRTDALAEEFAHEHNDDLSGAYAEAIDLCRELERELAALKRDAERWAFLPLLHAMDITAEVMGAQTPQDLRRGLERRVDALIAKAHG